MTSDVIITVGVLIWGEVATASSDSFKLVFLAWNLRMFIKNTLRLPKGYLQ